MNCLVLVKQVPDNNSVFRINNEGTWIDESSLSYALNEFDRYALEEALKLKDSGVANEVTVLTVGSADSASVLRTCLATGADRAIHVQDDDLVRLDPLNLARVIQAAIRDEDFPLILGGLQAEDDNLTQVCGLIAGLTDRAFASAAVRLTLDGSALEVDRELENNQLQSVALSLPAVVTVQTGINTPRYASLKGIMAAKKKPVSKLGLADIGLALDEIGAQASQMSTSSLSPPPKGTSAEMVEGTPDEIASALVARIREKTGVI